MPKKLIWIISGEASGDIYGAELARELQVKYPEATLRGMGGPRMKEAGVGLFVDSTELGVVGVIEVLKSIFFFIRLLKDVIRRAEQEKPDAVVLIDYPGFNLQLAKRLHKLNIPIIYYISPQVWAWKKGRIPKIARDVTKLLCIFPFEPAVYAGTGLDVDFIGHPLLDILAPMRQKPVSRNDNLVLLLPGSRSSELKRLVSIFAKMAQCLRKTHPEMRFAMPLPREKTKQLASQLLAECQLDDETRQAIEISVGNTRELMQLATAGVAASGTVTVEAAMLGLPLVVSYKVNWLTYCMAKLLIKLPSITIANLVTKSTVYEEKLQYEATPEKLANALEKILPGGERREICINGMQNCVRMLGEGNKASSKAADAVIHILNSK